VEKHCSNSQCFKEKNYKAKNKIEKYNFEQKKQKKTMWGNAVAIHGVL
jgi:hypothetical protein